MVLLFRLLWFWGRYLNDLDGFKNKNTVLHGDFKIVPILEAKALPKAGGQGDLEVFGYFCCWLKDNSV
jgi:hypothetical protein